MAADPQAEFGRCMEELRIAAGNPPLIKLAGFASRDMWSRNQLGQILRGKFVRPPEWERVWAFVQACVAHAGLNVTPQLRILANKTVWWQRHSTLVQVLEASSIARPPTRTVGADASASITASERDTSTVDELNLHIEVPIQTGYQHLVRAIATTEPLGRDTELTELATFCNDPRRDGSYTWWQAPAWSGKTTLMAWFALHPPPGVRLVSFFITARLAEQSDRRAFVDNVLEQLLVIVGEDRPFMTETTAEGHLHRLLEQAAQLCLSRQESFVLLVDGLDEDRGVTDVPHAHSIAQLLPHKPPVGMRVIVSGRPNPPVPDDVDEHHPLRDARIVRLLSVSPHAVARRWEMTQDLALLLAGTIAEQDLVGLMIAARGGLTVPDLCELTGWTRRTVSVKLETVNGRVFAPRESRWGGPVGYLLGHEELDREGRQELGADRIDGYRCRLHVWAQKYRNWKWPEGTPEYLLGGYITMLLEERDWARAVEYVVDSKRQDRMLAVFAGDATALGEAQDLMQILVEQPRSDLSAIARVAVHRDRLRDRNTRIPAELAEVWWRLGDPHRAEEIARAIPDTVDQARALTSLAQAAAEYGIRDQAKRLATQAEKLVGNIANPFARAYALSGIVKALAEAGEYDRAEQLARVIVDPAGQTHALVEIAKALAEAGEYDRAEELARALIYTDSRDRLLARMAMALINVSEHGRAERLARTIVDPDSRIYVLIEIAKSLAEAGEYDRAERIARIATITETCSRTRALMRLAWVDAQFGNLSRFEKLAYIFASFAQINAQDPEERGSEVDEPSRAEQLAHAISDPAGRAAALAEIAKVVVQIGDHKRARRLAIESEQLARSITTTDNQAYALSEIAKVLAEAGEHDQAERLARIVLSPDDQVRVLNASMQAAARAGEYDKAKRLAHATINRHDQAIMLGWLAGEAARSGNYVRSKRLLNETEQLARIITKPFVKAYALAEVAKAAAQVGEHDRAEQLARSITDSDVQDNALTWLKERREWNSDHKASARQANDTGWLARTVTKSSARNYALAEVAKVLGQAGELDHAERLGRLIDDTVAQVCALTTLARLIVEAGNRDHASRLLTDATSIITHAIVEPLVEASVLSEIAKVLAHAGEFDRAEQLAHTINNLKDEASALSEIAKVLAHAGEFDRAEQLAHTIKNPNARASTLAWLAGTATQVGDAVLAERMAAAAEQIADAIVNPFTKAHMLTEITIGLAQSGDYVQAARIANSITKPDDRASALAILAEAVQESGANSMEPSIQTESDMQAARILGTVIVQTSWQSAAHVLGSVCLDAARAIAHEILILLGVGNFSKPESNVESSGSCKED